MKSSATKDGLGGAGNQGITPEHLRNLGNPTPTNTLSELDEILKMPKEWVCDVQNCKTHHTTMREALTTYISKEVAKTLERQSKDLLTCQKIHGSTRPTAITHYVQGFNEGLECAQRWIKGEQLANNHIKEGK